MFFSLPVGGEQGNYMQQHELPTRIMPGRWRGGRYHHDHQTLAVRMCGRQILRSDGRHGVGQGWLPRHIQCPVS